MSCMRHIIPDIRDRNLCELHLLHLQISLAKCCISACVCVCAPLDFSILQRIFAKYACIRHVSAVYVLLFLFLAGFFLIISPIILAFFICLPEDAKKRIFNSMTLARNIILSHLLLAS